MQEKDFIDWLQDQRDQIMGEEKQALALLKNGDEAGYRQKMATKAELLAELSDKAQNRYESLPLPLKNDVAKTLKNFSANANTAMNLDSVFYMSALLYPDDYQEGCPDNLQLLINKIKKQSANK